MGLQRELAATASAKLVFAACCRNLAHGRHHATGKGCAGAEGQSWFSGVLQKLGLGLVSIWQSWIMLAFPVNVAIGSQVSCCFVAGFLCDLCFFFKIETIPGLP